MMSKELLEQLRASLTVPRNQLARVGQEDSSLVGVGMGIGSMAWWDIGQ